MSGEVKFRSRNRSKKMKQEHIGSGDKSDLVTQESLSSSAESEEDIRLSKSESKLSNSESKETIQDSETPEKLEKPVRTQEVELVLWRNPVTVIHYSVMETVIILKEWARYLTSHTLLLYVVVALLGCYFLLHLIPGRHTEGLLYTERYITWCLWWVGLGILSSVGLGTGLHTFLLYLGPHIAAVTMAAYECGTTDFPEPPYPAQILCPQNVSDTDTGSVRVSKIVEMSIWAILSKVRVEAFCWGAGTAIGELPPYFMARAARLSGSEPGEDTEEFLELQEKLKHPERMTRFERAKYAVQQLVERVGFFGILACASIPNPLFDLAGITCGHFLVPFWTFFGATLIGKAVVKMHIQKIFVILAFNQQLFETAVSVLVKLPLLGPLLEAPVRSLLIKQKEKLHGGGSGDNSGSIVSSIFEIFVLSMVTYFIISIVNSLAQSYQKRLTKDKRID